MPKRILIWGLTMVLLLPMGFSLYHHLMQHEVNVCMAEGEQHVHEYHWNCDHEHFYSTNSGLEPQLEEFSLRSIPVYREDQLHPVVYKNPYLLSHQGRGPPSMTFVIC